MRLARDLLRQMSQLRLDRLLLLQLDWREAAHFLPTQERLGHSDGSQVRAAKASTCSLPASSVHVIMINRGSFALHAAANMSTVIVHPTADASCCASSHSHAPLRGPRKLRALALDPSSTPSDTKDSPLTCRNIGNCPALMQSMCNCSVAACRFGFDEPFFAAPPMRAHSH